VEMPYLAMFIHPS